MGSSPPRRRSLDLFQQFFISVLCLAKFTSVTLQYCSIGQIIVVNNILSVLMSLYFPWVCFHERATITQLTIRLV